LFDGQTIKALETEQEAAPHLRAIQKALAKDITIRVHGEAEYEKAIKSSEFLFGNTGIEFLSELNDDEIIGLFEGVPNHKIDILELQDGMFMIEMLAVKTSIFASKGEAKKMLEGGGVAINKSKVMADEPVYPNHELINNRFMVVQKGKKNYFLIIAE
jgi:tyrosyl-tRNA synthetase